MTAGHMRRSDSEMEGAAGVVASAAGEVMVLVIPGIPVEVESYNTGAASH